METSESLRMKVGTRRLGGVRENGGKDFMILCPTVAENSGVLEALYALYYLPLRYKLLIAAVGEKSEAAFNRVRDIIRTELLSDRVIIRDISGLPGTAIPFSDANVVVYGSSDPMYAKHSPQTLVVFDIASKITSANGSHNFAVAKSSPEALASAILQVARNQR